MRLSSSVMSTRNGWQKGRKLHISVVMRLLKSMKAVSPFLQAALIHGGNVSYMGLKQGDVLFRQKMF